MIDVRQILESIITPTLLGIGLDSPAARRLLLGTAAHESEGFRWLHAPRGEGLSWFGITAAAHEAFWEETYADLLRLRPETAGWLMAMVPRRWTVPPADYLVVNPAYAAAICRLLYWRVEAPLPSLDDMHGLAGYWHEHYADRDDSRNTPEAWLQAYADYCRVAVRRGWLS